jgi:hypothetical protein
LDIDMRRWKLFGDGVRLLSNIEQRFPKPNLRFATVLRGAPFQKRFQ